MSIKPKWVEKIASGEKTVEVRKSVPKCGTPFKVYIYCTQDKNYKIAPFDFADGWHIKKYDDTTHYACGCTWRKREDLNGKVVGEFVCDEVFEIENSWFDEGFNRAAKQGCIYLEDLALYLGGNDGYGLHISDLKIYDKPLNLSDFDKPCSHEYTFCDYYYGGSFYEPPSCNCEEAFMLTRPPQSWQFVEEL